MLVVDVWIDNTKSDSIVFFQFAKMASHFVILLYRQLRLGPKHRNCARAFSGRAFDSNIYVCENCLQRWNRTLIGS